MNNKISVIIPAYNTADVICRTLRSVESQTYKNYEIVIVNDGSTDGTTELLNSYCDSKSNVVVHHQENQGVSAARNKGIELATGDFICFLDSDDTYELQFLEKMILKQQQSDADVVYCSFCVMLRNGKIKKEKLNINKSGALLFYFENWLHLSTLLIKRDFILNKSIKFDEQRIVGEDSLFTVELLVCANTAYVDEHLHNYHHRHNSITRSCHKESYYIEDLKSWEYIKEYTKNNYHNADKEQVIFSLITHKSLIKLNYLVYLLKNFKFSALRNYIEETGLCDLSLCVHSLSCSNKRKFNFIVKNNYFIFFIGAIYYNYVRKIIL